MKHNLFTLLFALMASTGTIFADTQTITVAQALEIGQGLPTGASSDETYTIVGYVAGIETSYSTQYGNQNYWIADAQSGNVSGALYVYRGACAKAVKLGYKVSMQANIYKYQDLVIETSEKAAVTILEETEATAPTLIAGTCGADGDSTNLSFQLNLSTWALQIQGSGSMADSAQHLPWQAQSFRNCIKTVELPDNINIIGMQAFDRCKKLSSIVIPESVEVIGKWAFYGCSSLKSLNIPDKVHAFGYAAFVGIGVTEPLKNARFFCFMPRNFTGKYTVPEGTEIVIAHAFDQCTNLTEVSFPATTTSLSYNALSGCSALQAITCYAIVPPTCKDETTFKDTDKSIPVYVPSVSVEAYKAAEYWKEFTNIQAIQTQGIEETNDGAKATKFIHDGQVLILRGDKNYTVQGQEVQ